MEPVRISFITRPGMTTAGRRSRLMRATAGCGLAALILAGCGSSGAGPRSADSNRAGAVALRYAKALFAGRFAAASRYVAPSGRNAFLVLTDGADSSSLRAHNLAVGSTIVTGSTAVTILTGSLCSRAGAAEHCVTNTDPASSSPIFGVDLIRQSNGRWLIIYPAQKSGSSGSITTTKS